MAQPSMAGSGQVRVTPRPDSTLLIATQEIADQLSAYESIIRDLEARLGIILEPVPPRSDEKNTSSGATTTLHGELLALHNRLARLNKEFSDLFSRIVI